MTVGRTPDINIELTGHTRPGLRAQINTSVHFMCRVD
jgi:hypothetical protein